MSVYEDIIRGLQEAVEYEQGTIKSRVHSLTVKNVKNYSSKQIKSIRLSTKMSQTLFAAALGVSVKTVEAWESGRNKPEGPSMRLLYLIENDPDFLKKHSIVGYKQTNEFRCSSTVSSAVTSVSLKPVITGDVNVHNLKFA